MPNCKAENCIEPIKGRGLCNKHLIRLRRHGDIAVVHPQARRACAILGCEGKHHARGWCIKHWNRWHSTGDPMMVRSAPTPNLPGALNPRFRGDDITYATAHWRMTRDDPARNHTCAHCGGQAAQWAYDHADENERHSEEGPFSVDPDHYIPLCVSCHVKFDRQESQALRAN